MLRTLTKLLVCGTLLGSLSTVSSGAQELASECDLLAFIEKVRGNVTIENTSQQSKRAAKKDAKICSYEWLRVAPKGSATVSFPFDDNRRAVFEPGVRVMTPTTLKNVPALVKRHIQASETMGGQGYDGMEALFALPPFTRTLEPVFSLGWDVLTDSDNGGTYTYRGAAGQILETGAISEPFMAVTLSEPEIHWSLRSSGEHPATARGVIIKSKEWPKISASSYLERGYKLIDAGYFRDGSFDIRRVWERLPKDSRQALQSDLASQNGLRPNGLIARFRHSLDSLTDQETKLPRVDAGTAMSWPSKFGAAIRISGEHVSVFKYSEVKDLKYSQFVDPLSQPTDRLYIVRATEFGGGRDPFSAAQTIAGGFALEADGQATEFLASLWFSQSGPDASQRLNARARDIGVSVTRMR